MKLRYTYNEDMVINSQNLINQDFNGKDKKQENFIETEKYPTTPHLKQQNQNHNFHEKIEQYQRNKLEKKKKSEFMDRKTKLSNRWVVKWSIEEDWKLFQKYEEIGSKWTQLAKIFPEKSDNAVKNRFYCCMRKVERRMNKHQKQRKQKNKKPITINSLLTIMQIGKYQILNDDKRIHHIQENFSNLIKLRQTIIEVARQPQQIIHDYYIEELIQMFQILKFSLKFMNMQRVKKIGKKNKIGQMFQLEKYSQYEANNNQNNNEVIFYQLTEISQQKYDFILNQNILESAEDINQSVRKNNNKISFIQTCKLVLNLDSNSQQYDQFFFI